MRPSVGVRVYVPSTIHKKHAAISVRTGVVEAVMHGGGLKVKFDDGRVAVLQPEKVVAIRQPKKIVVLA